MQTLIMFLFFFTILYLKFFAMIYNKYLWHLTITITARRSEARCVWQNQVLSVLKKAICDNYIGLLPSRQGSNPEIGPTETLN